MVGIMMGFTFGGFASAMRPTRIRSAPPTPNASTPDPDRLRLPEPPLLYPDMVCATLIDPKMIIL
jgi:hypothetical protein